jgi:hypothetical protein
MQVANPMPPAGVLDLAHKIKSIIRMLGCFGFYLRFAFALFGFPLFQT